MQTLDIGEPVTLFSDWWDENGDPIEPDSITLTLTKPDGTVTTWTKPALTGTAGSPPDPAIDHWERMVVPDANGVWRYTFLGDIGGRTQEQGGAFLVGAGSSTSPTGPCEQWTDWDAVMACDDSLSELPTVQQQYAIDTASDILYNLSGRVYSGICVTTRSLCLSCVRCLPACCTCVPHNGIDLGIAAPVWGVWDVYEDGALLAATEYSVYDRRYLVKSDGTSWPRTTTTERMLDPATFRATWAYGRPIPQGGRNAARLFAAEIGKMCSGQACQIPQRVTNISREGVTFTVLDSMKMISEGKTSIALVDLWLVSDKEGRKAKPGMFSPMAAGTGATRIA